jgi:murein DD-endopeptidase MepM/ murein hydrolase activator NlpD
MSVTCTIINREAGTSAAATAAAPRYLRLACGLAALVVSACGGGSDGTSPPTPPAPAAVATVEVSPPTASLLVGATTQLSATTRDAAGNTLTGRTVTWSSASPTVATIISTGLVTAVAAGTANITATSESRSGFASVTVTVPPVANISVTPGTSSVLAGATVQLTATPRDPSGSTLVGRTITWTSSAPTVAGVSSAGLVTTLAPGSAIITATAESRSATASVEVVDPLRIPAFSRPFAANVDYFTTNFHDHDVPRPFLDNGRKVTFWGESYNATGYEGHEGYDWRMAEGTPILAVAAGTVLTTDNPSFVCPILNTTIPANGNGIIVITHDLPGGVQVRAGYAHLSRKDVRTGDRVTAGQQIGLSGGVGCSLNPHLHFAVTRVTQTKNGQPSIIDSFGWEGSGVDPWLAEADGATSINLWKPNEAPSLFTRNTLDFNANGGTAFFGLSTLQAMGVRDATTPNNEFLEVSRDARFAPATLSIAGSMIRTRAGIVFTFPAGATLSEAVPTIRVYSGAGINTASVFYMGRGTEAYDNLRECVEVLNSGGQGRGRIGWGAGCP